MRGFNPRKVRPTSGTNRFRGLALSTRGSGLNDAYVGELENFRSTRLREMSLREGQVKSGERYSNTVHSVGNTSDGVRVLGEGGSIHFRRTYPARYQTPVGDWVQEAYRPSLDIPWDTTDQYNLSDPKRTIDKPVGYPIDLIAQPKSGEEKETTEESPSQGTPLDPIKRGG